MAFFDPNYCSQNPTDPMCGAGSTGTGGGWTGGIGMKYPPVPNTPPFVPNPAGNTTTVPGDDPGKIITVTNPATPWYKTWWGIGGLVVVGFVGLKAIKRKKA